MKVFILSLLLLSTSSLWGSEINLIGDKQLSFNPQKWKKVQSTALLKRPLKLLFYVNDEKFRAHVSSSITASSKQKIDPVKELDGLCRRLKGKLQEREPEKGPLCLSEYSGQTEAIVFTDMLKGQKHFLVRHSIVTKKKTGLSQRMQKDLEALYEELS